MKILTVLATTVLFELALCSARGSMDALDSPERAVAENFADAIHDENALLGVFVVPNGLRPTVLPSGSYLENTPGYSEALLRNSLCLLRATESLHGEVPAFLFVSQLPVRVEHETHAPFIALPGSRWILALQRDTNVFAAVDGVDVGYQPVDVVRSNVAKLFNGSRGAACLEWSGEKGLGAPSHIVSINSTVLDDVRRIRDHQAIDKGTRNKRTSDGEDVQKLLKSEFGKTMYQRMLYNRLRAGE